MRILILDDDKYKREFIKEIAHAFFECTIDEATDVNTALILHQKNVYDCVFIDFHLPRITGDTVLFLLKRIKDPTLYILNTPDIFAREKYLEFGFDEAIEGCDASNIIAILTMTEKSITQGKRKIALTMQLQNK